jgi:hypothetical protein
MSTGAAWAMFLHFLASNLDLLSLHEDVSLYIFCLSLDMDAALELDDTTEGSLVQKNSSGNKRKPRFPRGELFLPHQS